ncbi:hypothetical protein GF366_01715 [Candidatus Peregrinibacteria bacterium]|nr:hypothetical protein [Candidatus Peregrinibacteria bacterium]
MHHDNHTHNLLEQLVTEQKSLWRIKNMYGKDAGDCEKCREFWEKMKKDKEEHIAELTDLVKSHL